MKMKQPQFQMNDVLQDKISTFRGQVQGITYYATGCIHYGLAQLKLKSDGTVADWQWFDESRLKLVKKAVVEKSSEQRSGPDRNLRAY